VSNKIKFEFTSVDDFKDYNKSHAVVCLIKSVCVFNKLVELNGNDKAEQKSLHEQLKSKVNGSLELRTWTGLPHGSGLGISSILIGCVLKVVWHFVIFHFGSRTAHDYQWWVAGSGGCYLWWLQVYYGQESAAFGDHGEGA
jgi:galactokinase/mevalonate kinase-like predicted kinase